MSVSIGAGSYINKEQSHVGEIPMNYPCKYVYCYPLIFLLETMVVFNRNAGTLLIVLLNIFSYIVLLI